MFITAAPLSSAPGHFSAASSDGHVLVKRSRMPLLDSARALLTAGNSTHVIIMQRGGVDVLITTVGHAARLTVGSDACGRPIFVRTGYSSSAAGALD
jgi:hypothetical protein